MATVVLVQGALRGREVTTEAGVTYLSFQGVPYAKSQRFKAPEPADPWEGTRDALKEGPVAAQIDKLLGNGFSGEEDCLFLNVYTNKLPDGPDNKARPVMVWVHGGGFYLGSGNTDLYGPDYFMNTGGVVLITLNYRLGPLGFLATGDEQVPGNMGFKDQVMALRWVQLNIAHFGGDSGNVTIFGESAGAGSVHHLTLSPMCKGLFHRAIAQSGCALLPWAFVNSSTARKKAFKLGEALGCHTQSSKELVQFLEKMPVQELLEGVEKALGENGVHPLPLMFAPTTEEGEGSQERFLSDAPANIICEGTYNHVPLMIGYTAEEGIFVLKGQETVTVTIEQGELQGKVATTVRGLNYYSFQGIPYAKAPVGPLRFKAPEPADPWEGTRGALEQGPVCPQPGYVINEDCLFVNVYSTSLPEAPSENLRPVLVWIHGGGYNGGSGNIEQQGPDYLLEEDIVLVTLNYRLGALGFISLQGTEVSSNNGLKDQSLALRWVQQNIAQFGGDPSRVTIWGESAGAGSVHGHMLSPMSQGLFHQVISQSGSVLSHWSLYPPGAARDTAFRLGEALGTTTNDTAVLIQALRSASTQEIVDATFRSGTVFTVDIENEVAPGEQAFLPASPWELILQGKYSDVPLLIGTNAQESIVVVSLFLNIEYYNEHLEEALPWHFGGSKEVAAKVKDFYFGGNITQEKKLQFGNLQTDFLFLYPVDSQVKLQSAVSSTPLFYYRFSFDGLLGVVRRRVGDLVPGVPHADELGYIFYTSYNDPGFPSDRPEMTTLARIIKMWTNFVKTGNPTPYEDPLLQNVTWSPFTRLDHFYLDIGNDLIIQRDVSNDRLGFMADIYSSVNFTAHNRNQ